MNKKYRIENDVLGEVKVPLEAYWGVNTQRAINNFQISNKRFNKNFLDSLALVKKAALLTNNELGIITDQKSKSILQAIEEIISQKKFYDQFPIDVFQTGSGTQINMNMNEVLANRANELLGHKKGKKSPIHPNDDVNMSQSSNDVIPTTMQLSALNIMKDKLFPTLDNLIEALDKKIEEFTDIVKVGRTHLQDAVPIPLSLEFQVYKRQIEISKDRFKSDFDELCAIPLGGTVLGTGINTPNNFTDLAIHKLSQITGISLRPKKVLAEGIASHNTIVKVGSTVNLLALSLIKMANDIRWMGSGPRSGLSEIILPENEPGSSIMPGKINPTQSEMLIQTCLHIMGLNTSIFNSELMGSVLDLNVCKPIMIYNLLESIELVCNGIQSFIGKCLNELKVNEPKIEQDLNNLLMIVTNLNPYIGYDKASEIAQKAYKEGKSIKQVIEEMGLEFEEDLDDILDPKKMV
ncbi:MAG: class II fumarate hydratase [Candidatus Lokiarchaeota archaeon]